MNEKPAKLWRYTAMFLVFNVVIALIISAAIQLIYHTFKITPNSSAASYASSIISILLSAYGVHYIFYKRNGVVLSAKQNKKLIFRCSITSIIIQFTLILLAVGIIALDIIAGESTLFLILFSDFLLAYKFKILLFVSAYFILYMLIILSGFYISRFCLLRASMKNLRLNNS